MARGRLLGLGVGPGDPELITVRGRRLLAHADVVVADRLAPQELLAELGPHVEAFCEVLEHAAGLPPAGVTDLGSRTRA